MSDDGFDPRSYDVRYLTPLQWTARKRSIIKRAHAERRRAIHLMFACAFGAVRSACRRMRQRQEARDALRSMTDYELKDIGLARSGSKPQSGAMSRMRARRLCLNHANFGEQ
jgi:uncharacterized protein YjiS (DUF1127 family)